MATEVAIKQQNRLENTDLTPGNIFQNPQSFEMAIRMAKALASSTIVPKEYQNNLGNCLIALEMSMRIKTSPLMVMQNLYIVNGRPAWSSQFIIAMINSSKKYKTELQYHIEGAGDKMSCYAFVEDWNGHIVSGPVISMQMAKDEGWLDKNMSKWKTMPEVMIRYRAASFFGRINCPDMIMGIYSTDEVIEMSTDDYQIFEVATEVEQEIEENANQELISDDTHAPDEVPTENPESEPESRPEQQPDLDPDF